MALPDITAYLQYLVDRRYRRYTGSCLCFTTIEYPSRLPHPTRYTSSSVLILRGIDTLSIFDNAGKSFSPARRIPFPLQFTYSITRVSPSHPLAGFDSTAIHIGAL